MKTRYLELSNPLFQAGLPILQQIEAQGYEAYFVGGCIRDSLLGLAVHDIDIATSAMPDEIEFIFNHTIDLGKEHGTIIVVSHKQTFEVTTFRTESQYSDHRRPDQVEFVRNLEEDTLRRDFTINALAADSQGRLYDYHQGLQDLEAGIIRAVGVAHDRFNEDALRMMRAIRFASQLGFHLEDQTQQAISDLACGLGHISIERCRSELTLWLKGAYFPDQAHLILDTGLNCHLPFLEPLETEHLKALGRRFAVLIDQDKDRPDNLVWMLLLDQLGYRDRPAIIQVLKRWKHSKQFIQEVVQLQELYHILYQDASWNRRIVYQYPAELLDLIEGLYKAEGHQISQSHRQIAQDLTIQNRSQLAIDGKGVMDHLGLTRGNARVGQLLDEMEDLVIHDQLANNLESLQNYIDSCQ